MRSNTNIFASFAGTNAISACAAFVMKLVVVIACMLFSLRAGAQTTSVRMMYRFDSSVIEPAYMGNGRVIASIDSLAAAGAFASADHLQVVSYSSPEGVFEYNRRLSDRRAEAFRSWLVARYPELQGKISVLPTPEEWHSLRQFVEADTRLSSSSRREIIDIIDSSVSPDKKEAQLKAMSVWPYVYSAYFRNLRYAEVTLVGETQGQRNASGMASGSNAYTSVNQSSAASYDAASFAGQGNTILFKLAQSDLDRDFAGNAGALSVIDELLANGKYIRIVSTASPEGPEALNKRLSAERGEALRKYILSLNPDYADRISVSAIGEDWNGFRKAIASDSYISDESRARILEVIDSNDSNDAKEQKIRRMPEWNHIFNKICPELRYTKVMIEQARTAVQPVTADTTNNNNNIVPADTTAVAPADNTTAIAPADTTAVTPAGNTTVMVPADTTVIAPADTTVIAATDTVKVSADSTASFVPVPVAVPVTSVPEFRPKKTIFALKTNLLYDAVTALNFEVEVPFAKRYSIMAEDVFPWWETGNKYCFQMWEIGLEGRYWFKSWDPDGTDKLRGWFAGPYVMSSKYDFQYDRSLNYQGEYWSAGVSAGYSAPIGRNKRNRLEFSVGLGYLDTHYRHYNPADDYSKLIRDRSMDGKLSYFGPTKAKISLVIPINVPMKSNKGENHE